MLSKHKFFKRFPKTLLRPFCTETTLVDESSKSQNEQTENPKELSSKQKQKGHSIRLTKYFESHQHLKEIRRYIPEKYLTLKRKTAPESMYLIDQEIARDVVSHILPILKEQKNQVVAETNAGLGFISTELLERGMPTMRLYESCSDFRQGLLVSIHSYFRF